MINVWASIGAEIDVGIFALEVGCGGSLLTNYIRFNLEESEALNGCVPGGRSDGYDFIMVLTSI